MGSAGFAACDWLSPRTKIPCTRVVLPKATKRTPQRFAEIPRDFCLISPLARLLPAKFHRTNHSACTESESRSTSPIIIRSDCAHQKKSPTPIDTINTYRESVSAATPHNFLDSPVQSGPASRPFCNFFWRPSPFFASNSRSFPASWRSRKKRPTRRQLPATHARIQPRREAAQVHRDEPPRRLQTTFYAREPHRRTSHRRPHHRRLHSLPQRRDRYLQSPSQTRRRATPPKRGRIVSASAESDTTGPRRTAVYSLPHHSVMCSR